MKKYLILFIAVLLIIILGFILYKSGNIPIFTETPAVKEINYNTEKISEKADEPPYYEINFEYPKFSDLSNVNDDIKQNISGIPEEFKKNLFETCSNKDFKCTLINTFTVYSNDKLVSVNFNYYSYTGGAHGLTTTLVLNYKTSDGKRIYLSDVFKKDSQYLDKISSYCAESLKESLSKDGGMVDENWLKEGTAPKQENYNSVGFSEHGLVVTFAQYQVAPYAVGEQIVMIPYGELKDLIDENGVLADKI